MLKDHTYLRHSLSHKKSQEAFGLFVFEQDSSLLSLKFENQEENFMLN